MNDFEVEEIAPENAAERTGDLGSVISRIVNMISKQLSPGDVAALRRLTPGDTFAPAFWKLAAVVLEEMLPPKEHAGRDDLELRWAVILCAMAHAQGLHRPGRSLGAALAEAGFSELRFSRLLRARGDQVFPMVRAAAQYLASKGVPFDAHDLARLVLSEGGPSEEKVRRYLARSYYRQLS